MAVNYKDGNGLLRVRKGTGTGTGGDPDIIEYLETNSAAIKTAVEAIQTAVQTLDNIVAGTEAQVDVLTLPALPTGDNNFGNVDVLTVPADPFGANADAAATAGSTGSIQAKLRLMTSQLDELAGAITAGVMSVTLATKLDAANDSVTIGASENLIGKVGASDIVVEVVPTCAAATYTAGYLLFDSVEIPLAVRVAAGTAILQSVTIEDKDDQGAGMILLIANAATDFGTANATPDPDDTESQTVVAVVPVASSAFVDLGANRVATVSNIGALCKAAAASTSLWVAAITTGTPTMTASGLVLKLGFLRS